MKSTTIERTRYYEPPALAQLRKRLVLLDDVEAGVAAQATRSEDPGPGAYGYTILARLGARGYHGFEARNK